MSLSFGISLFITCINYLKIDFCIPIVTVLKLQLNPLSFLLARLQPITFTFALKFVRLVTNLQTAPTQRMYINNFRRNDHSHKDST